MTPEIYLPSSRGNTGRRCITLTSAGRIFMLSSTTKNLHKRFPYPCYITCQSHLPLIFLLCFSTCYLTPLSRAKIIVKLGAGFE